MPNELSLTIAGVKLADHRSKELPDTFVVSAEAESRFALLIMFPLYAKYKESIVYEPGLQTPCLWVTSTPVIVAPAGMLRSKS